MADTANRVLSLEEVLALPDGARVWVEMSGTSYFRSDVHRYSPLRERSIREIHEPRLVDSNGGWFPVSAEWVNDEYRVWSLPQPPTQEEMDANPWEARDDDKVLCPYCGAEMVVEGETIEDVSGIILLLGGWCLCEKCGSRSPYVNAADDAQLEERALSAALRRYIEPNRVLTWQEMLEHPNDMPIITEVKGGRLELLYNDRPANPIRFEAAKKNYNKTARAWLRIPTDEERQSVAWEGSE